MYLLTMGWFLAHTSLAMTPEHSATNGELLVSEICKSRALQEHVPLISQCWLNGLVKFSLSLSLSHHPLSLYTSFIFSPFRPRA